MVSKMNTLKYGFSFLTIIGSIDTNERQLLSELLPDNLCLREGMEVCAFISLEEWAIWMACQLKSADESELKHRVCGRKIEQKEMSWLST